VEAYISAPIPSRGEVELSAPLADAIVLARVLSGDNAAFHMLVRRYQRPLHRVAMRYARSEHLADEIVQRAFVKAFEGIGALRDPSSFRPWLFRIVVNLALNELRDGAREVPLTEGNSREALSPSAGQEFEVLERRQRLKAAIESLPPKQRLVVELRVWDDLSFRDVAIAASCSEDAAKVNFHHAIKKLRSYFGAGEER